MEPRTLRATPSHAVRIEIPGVTQGAEAGGTTHPAWPCRHLPTAAVTQKKSLSPLLLQTPRAAELCSCCFRNLNGGCRAHSVSVCVCV